MQPSAGPWKLSEARLQEEHAEGPPYEKVAPAQGVQLALEAPTEPAAQ